MKFRNSHIGIVMLLLFVVATSIVQAQQKDSHTKEVKSIFQSFKKLSTYSYQYKMKVIFPDSTSETMNGTVYYDQTNKVMFQDNKAFTLLYNGKWFYKADHLEKAISLINVTKYLDGKAEELEIDEVFKGQLTDEYIDSFIIRYGVVTAFKQEGNIQSATLSFDQQAGALQNIDISYDVKRALPVRLKMTTYYPYQKGGAGYRQIITCDRYSTAPQKKDMSVYFLIRDGKVILKQYKNYQLNSLL